MWARMKPPASLGTRLSGVLLHPTSLPGPHGSGDLGAAARAFADWLAAAGQSYWQVLPVVPPAGGNSPYQSTSVFAGNPQLIDLVALHEAGLLTAADVAPAVDLPEDHVDFARTAGFRDQRLRRAFDAFRARPDLHEPFQAFCAREQAWLDDYALYCALKDEHQGRAWSDWAPPIRDRAPDAVAEAQERLRGEVRYHQFLQFEFHRQWALLRAYCGALGIALVGDIPIFVGHDSADVWKDPHLFHLDQQGQPTVVAGVPPDYFSKTGQRWGNVLYRWGVHKGEGYRWWIARFRSMLEKFDAVRVDHFIGFHRYWEIDAHAPDATSGRYRPGPGADLFVAVEAALGKMPIIAEDLGVVTREVDALRERFSFPGMRVLHFSFTTDPTARHILPHAYPKMNVVYTGTHDNNTSMGWLGELRARAADDQRARDELEFVLRYVGSDGREFHWDLIRMALMSHVDIAILPAQDLLGLGAEARMNVPGRTDGNWGFRVRPGQLTDAIRARLGLLTETYARTALPG
jgi:4-alpha-glucanotransferase